MAEASASLELIEELASGPPPSCPCSSASITATCPARSLSASPLHHQLAAQLNFLAYMHARYEEVLRVDVSPLPPHERCEFLRHVLQRLVLVESQRHSILVSEMKERMAGSLIVDDAPDWVMRRLPVSLHTAAADEENGPHTNGSDSDCIIVDQPTQTMPLHINGRVHPAGVIGQKRGRDDAPASSSTPIASQVNRALSGPLVERNGASREAIPPSSPAALAVTQPHASLPMLQLPPPAVPSPPMRAVHRPASVLDSPVSTSSSASSSPFPVNVNVSCPAPSSVPVPAPPRTLFLLPPLQRDVSTRLTPEKVVSISERLPGSQFRLVCLPSHSNDRLVKRAQRLLKHAFVNSGEAQQHVYYLLITAPYAAVPIVSASYFILQYEERAAHVHVNLFMTREEMRGTGFGSLLFEGYREVTRRLAQCREWMGLEGGCQLVVHSLANSIGWWRRMGCVFGEKVKSDEEGFTNTWPMLDAGPERTDAQITNLLESARKYSPGDSGTVWGSRAA